MRSDPGPEDSGPTIHMVGISIDEVAAVKIWAATIFLVLIALAGLLLPSNKQPARDLREGDDGGCSSK
ncbi:MAG: hypothetical protein A2172_04050 [Candidatus Woykebacteria bacterium RBG_13_40_15]|uniref:Uncharacterized protein n=1 Tax=Candidatus Woykebacteria bacterium RBG_13_40_15 TaxID=1802593 RepID=A0A1G1W6T7_9BACT|nr:MAG: hypothetical protein A2172_04050 [Candidatus Woykebacteria bacterium RBG_13_40_15]